MEFFEAQEGVYTGEIPAEFGLERPEEEAAASAVRPAPPTSTEEPREKKPRKGGQSHIHPSRRGRGRSKEDQAVAGHPWCCSSLFGPDGEDGRCCGRLWGPGFLLRLFSRWPAAFGDTAYVQLDPQLGESTAVTSLREVDVRHFVAPLQPQRNGRTS